MSFLVEIGGVGVVGSGGVISRIDKEDVKVLVELKKESNDDWDVRKLPKIEDDSNDKRNELKDEVILCLASSPSNLLAVGTSKKMIRVFSMENIEAPKHLVSVEVPKAPTSLTFDKDNSHVIVGDRAGDVHRFSLDSKETQELAGAISMMLDVKMSTDGKRLLLADRDEKLRIVRYPNTFVIEHFCLANTEYIRSIAVEDDRYCWTAGGDKTLRRWNYTTGELVFEQKLDVSQGIRKIVAKNGMLYILVEKMARVIMVNMETKEQIEMTIENEEKLMDMAIVKEELMIVGSKSIHTKPLGSSGKSFTAIDASGAIVNTEDAVENLYKNVTHNNQEEYEKRKAAKFAQIEEKKTLKRKAEDC